MRPLRLPAATMLASRTPRNNASAHVCARKPNGVRLRARPTSAAIARLRLRLSTICSLTLSSRWAKSAAVSVYPGRTKMSGSPTSVRRIVTSIPKTHSSSATSAIATASFKSRLLVLMRDRLRIIDHDVAAVEDSTDLGDTIEFRESRGIHRFEMVSRTGLPIVEVESLAGQPLAHAQVDLDILHGVLPENPVVIRPQLRAKEERRHIDMVDIADHLLLPVGRHEQPVRAIGRHAVARPKLPVGPLRGGDTLGLNRTAI